MIRSVVLLLACMLSAASALAQEPLQPYDARGRYRTGGVEGQLTGPFGGGRDVLLSWGRMTARGGGGRWMVRTEMAAGIHAGESLVDQALAGPRISAALAEPGWYTEVSGTRADPYLLAGGGVYGVATLAGASRDVGLSPTLFAGIGFRLFEDEWDVALTHLEVAVQKRFGTGGQRPQVYIRFSRSAPPPRPAAHESPYPGGPAPPPPAGRR